MSEPAKIPNSIKFLFGGTSGMLATCVVQPLDLVKTRMQVSKGAGGVKPSTVSVISGVIKNEGITTLYNGLSAGLLRQATYTTTRLGIYTWLFETFSTDGKAPNFFMKAALGMTAGGVGAFVGTPAEVALIRMTSDGSLPVEQRRNYSSVFNALARIYKEEGIATLWKGATPTIARAMVVNAAQLASYSQAKQGILDTGYIQDGIFCHFLASMFSGLVTTIASMPVDIAKTRLQSMKYIDGKPEYKGAADVLAKVIKNEGFFSLWKGFTPYYFRLGPHTVLTFIFLEQMNKTYKEKVLGIVGGSDSACLPSLEIVPQVAQVRMAPKAKAGMKAGMKAAGPMTKSAITEALATATELKKSECSKVLDSLAAVAAKEVKKTGKFTLPGLAMIKTRVKPATKAGKKEVFGKVIMVKAKPAKTVVKAYCVAALKKAV